MTSFRDKFGQLTVGQAIEMNETAELMRKAKNEFI